MYAVRLACALLSLDPWHAAAPAVRPIRAHIQACIPAALTSPSLLPLLPPLRLPAATVEDDDAGSSGSEAYELSEFLLYKAMVLEEGEQGGPAAALRCAVLVALWTGVVQVVVQGRALA